MDQIIQIIIAMQQKRPVFVEGVVMLATIVPCSLSAEDGSGHCWNVSGQVEGGEHVTIFFRI